MTNNTLSVRSNLSARPPTSASVADLQGRVTQQLITALEAGVTPWICPWSRNDLSSALPVNAPSSRPYRGIKVLFLNARRWECGFRSNRWRN